MVSRATLVGEIVDGHELVRIVATGGMGEVYLGRHLRLGIQRAIKVIREDQRADPTAAARFVREAHVLSHLQHNSIVHIVEFGELPNGWPFLVMEYIDGPNLDRSIEARGPFAAGDAMVVLQQIASALAYAHTKGVVHRDLKPANVLLRGGDLRQVTVIDFGIAYTVSAATMSRLTAEGQMLGSPLYMAPEQADGTLDVTPAVDSYAFAGIAYTLLSGKPVFPGLQLIGLIRAHAAETPERLCIRCPQIPRLLDEMLYACLAKDPAARPGIDELAHHLARLTRASGAADIPSRTTDTELVRLVSTPPDDDSEPLLNQLDTLVGDIAATLCAQQPNVARLFEAARRTRGELTNLEIELAMLDAEAEDPEAAGRTEFDAERTRLIERATSLRSQVTESRRCLASEVESMRAIGNAKTRELFVDLDLVVAQLRSVTR